MTELAWTAAACPPGTRETPADAAALDWLPAPVPGTAASALRDAGRLDDGHDCDAEDWWFRTTLAEPAAGDGERIVLRFGGIATVSEVWLGGELVLESSSMYAAHELDVTDRVGAGDVELAIRCHALAPLLAVRRKPRARWRTKVVADGTLRFFRTPVLGRAPGFAPGPAPVGPWRPVTVERRSGPQLRALVLRPRLEGDDGVLSVRADVDGPATVALGAVEAALVDGRAELRIPGVDRWWPHTHGEPVLHDVVVRAGDAELARRRVGFRALAWAPDLERDGLDLRVNGVPVFCRGAIWTTPDPVGLAPTRDELRAALADCVRAGMNMLRIPGTAPYEDVAFHDLADELGILVWQDFAFANMDFPIADPGFRAAVETEVRAVLGELAGRPSLAVLCGNSEVEQQAAMVGRPPEEGRGELFGELLPALIGEAEADVPYVPSAPCGGDLPFRPGTGIAHYFGVGGYRRPLADARRTGVRFAAECLAFAHVGDEVPGPPRSAEWKAGVPRDSGVDWDFDDVRDHYLAELYGEDPAALAASDPDRYAALGREVTGEVLAETFGEWRRTGSPCRGGLVLWLRDRVPGAGWGLVDAGGRPKVAWHHARRALAPLAIWTTDEGLDGIDVHLANDTAEPLGGTLRVALYRDGELQIDVGTRDVALPPRGALTINAEAVLGHFADAGYAYRFGPPEHDLLVASLDGEDDAPLVAAARFTGPRPAPVDDLGLEGRIVGDDLVVSTRQVAWGVRVRLPGLTPGDDAFTLEPGRERRIALEPAGGDGSSGRGVLTALNLVGTRPIEGAP